ncbi:hypothetical protein EPH_0011770 [Eimeria praecox]|uniref:Uncharacterized protein n=1 Tax=Eimeria praecox TaxID=51316 RepID=U6GXG4_9EIME|nr:hypothetical protein EPH_0011770 [Eimeria praecox]
MYRVGIEVTEGLWLGEQRGQQNSLKLLLGAGTHTLRVRVETDSSSSSSSSSNSSSSSSSSSGSSSDSSSSGGAKTHYKNALRDKLLADAQVSRCLRFSLHLSVHSVAGGDGDTSNPIEECSAFGALPLPTDLNTSSGSGSLGGPLDSEGRVVIRTKGLLHSGTASRHRIAIQTKGEDLLVKVGVFIEDQTRSITMALQDGSAQDVEAVYDWTVGGGHRERIYRLRPAWFGGSLGPAANDSAFHLVLSGDGDNCLLFDLFIQSMPFRELHQMSECSSMGVSAVSPSDLFSAAAVQSAAALVSSNREQGEETQQQVVASLQPLQQQREGFLKSIEFEVAEPSFILAEVSYNFFVSHVEMDIVTSNSVCL